MHNSHAHNHAGSSVDLSSLITIYDTHGKTISDPDTPPPSPVTSPLAPLAWTATSVLTQPPPTPLPVPGDLCSGDMLTEATLANDLPGNGRAALRSCSSLPLATELKTKADIRRTRSTSECRRDEDNNYVAMVIAELLDSERGYVRDLRDTTEVCLLV